MFRIILCVFVLSFLTLSCADSRPGDSSEGIPGYLVNPENVSITISGSNVSFNAPAGTIVETDSQLSISFWTPSDAQISELADAASAGSISLDGVSFLGSIDPNSDGSLSVTVSVDNPQGNLGISLSVSSDKNNVNLSTTSTNQPTFIYKDFSENGNFSTLFSD